MRRPDVGLGTRRRLGQVPPVWRALAAGVVLVAMGCTSVTRTAVTSSGGATGVGAGSGTETALGSDAAGVTGEQTGSSESPGGSTAGVTGGSAGGASAAGAPTARSCDKVVKIGGSYSSDTGAIVAAVGGSGESLQNAEDYDENQKLFYQRMVDYVNANGGLAGCKIQMTYYDFRLTASDGWSAESQRMCAHMAEDQKVFAVIPGGAGENRTLVTCLAQHKVVNLFNNIKYRPSEKDFAEYRGYLYEPDWINPYRMGPVIDLLKNAGYFGPGSKVGILLADDGSGTNQHLVNDLWKPKLEAMGLPPQVFTFQVEQSLSQVGQSSSQQQSAVLQFKAAGVNRVMFTPDGASSLFLFTQAAEGQDYHPRYAMTSPNFPGSWGATPPAGQRPGAMAVSFLIGDMGPTPDAQQLATNPTNATRDICNAIYKGYTGSASVTNGYQLCDNFLFLHAALKGATEVTAQALLEGADRLARSFPTANGFANARFGPPHHYDGATSARVMAWNEEAGVWQYVSPPQPMP